MPQFYLLSGSVFEKDGSPATGAAVGAAWKEIGSIGGPALSLTDENGRFSMLMEFHPYSRTRHDYRYGCDAKLDSVLVRSHSKTHQSPPLRVSVTEDTTLIQEYPVRVLEIKVAPLELLYAVDMPPFN